jgi:chemotaxis protein methyltransferase WspC
MMTAVCDENLSMVFRLLRERAGIDPDACGEESIAHVVRQCASASGSPEDYVRGLDRDPAAFQELLEAVVVPETWFFRDRLAFRAVQYYLDARQPWDRRTLRCLSVACSTGEEVYSLAIALRNGNVKPSQVRIVGTDVSNRALELARNGCYSSRSFRDSDEQLAEWRKHWCEPLGESWRVRDELRSGVEFRWGNLIQPEFLADESPFDVIFCRNVLIYFHTEARRVAVRQLERLLSAAGLLCCAAAEARIFSEAGFRSLRAEVPFAFQRQSEVELPVAAATERPLRPDTSRSLPDTIYMARPIVPCFDRTISPADRVESVFSGLPESVAFEGAMGEAASIASMLQAAQQAADSGRLDEAEALCVQVLALNPGSAEAYYLRGVVRQAQGMFDDARESLEKALYLDPRHYQALVHMTLLAERRGDASQANNYRRRASQLAPKEAK